MWFVYLRGLNCANIFIVNGLGIPLSASMIILCRITQHCHDIYQDILVLETSRPVQLKTMLAVLENPPNVLHLSFLGLGKYLSFLVSGLETVFTNVEQDG